MALLSRLLGREPDAQARGHDVAARLEALAQLDPIGRQTTALDDLHAPRGTKAC